MTTLHNFATPFVRYDIHDEAECGPYPCPCGRTLPTLTRVHGKRRPMLRVDDGRLKHSSAIAISMRTLENVQQYQVVFASDGSTRVYVVPKGNWSDGHSLRVAEFLYEFFEARIPVAIELVTRIEPSAGGKVVDFLIENS